MTEEQAAEAVVRALYPHAEWISKFESFIPCPGIDLHTKPNNKRECRITINDGKVPTIHCCHHSCKPVLNEANRAMRSAIGKLKTSATTGNHIRRGLAKAVTPKAKTVEPVAAPKRPLAPMPLPDPIEGGQEKHFAICFNLAELVSVVFGHPDHGGVSGRGETIPAVAFDTDPGTGTYIRVNPMRANGAGDADVAAWRHCLIECDKSALELQYAAIVASNLPVSVAVHSGGRSVHAWVRVDASTAEEFRERAKMAADAMEEWEGIIVDRSTLNPSRLARLAGKRRGDAMQALLATNLGATCWDDWLASRKQTATEAPAVPEPVAEAETREPAAFYYRKHKKDFILVKGGRVVPLDKDALKLALEFEGVADGADKEAIKAAIYEIMIESAIDYDGPLPGYCRGLHVQGGKRYFVDSQAEWLEPAKSTALGEGWPNILAFLQGLLCADDNPESLFSFYQFCFSLKLSREALRHALALPTGDSVRNVRPGPASVFCGAKSAGKSFLVNSIIAPLLGGRVADAHKAFVSGADGFNGELLGAEVWTVDDKVHANDLKSRRQFAASIKSFLYSGLTGFHAKFKEQISIRPWARLFILCNDQDEAIRVLPPLTDDISDKMHLWRCYTRHQFPTQTADEWAAYGAAVRAELPAFAGFIDQLEIPERRRCPRNGMRCWQDPHIVGLLADQTPEQALLDLLVHLAEAGQLKSIHSKTAHEILDILSNIEQAERQVRSLLHDDPAILGRYLGRLMSDAERCKLRGVAINREKMREKRGVWSIYLPTI